MPDYRKILVAYMTHIAEQEGITYVPRYRYTPFDVLTDDERAALLGVEDEVRVKCAGSLLHG